MSTGCRRIWESSNLSVNPDRFKRFYDFYPLTNLLPASRPENQAEIAVLTIHIDGHFPADPPIRPWFGDIFGVNHLIDG